MKARLTAVVAMAMLLLSACTSTKQFADVSFKPPQGDYSLIVMRPYVSVGLLTAGGAVEPREDWTEQARKNLMAALAEQQGQRGGRTTVAETMADAGADAAQVARLEQLHRAVGQSIQIHKYAGAALPTKADRFDWTLGEEAVAFGRATGHDYALFLSAEDSFSSSGRVALRALGFAGCLVGACIIVPGKTRLAFASLVDLRTGKVVWYNVLSSSVGDMRSPEGAASTVETLLAEMRPGQAVQEAAK